MKHRRHKKRVDTISDFLCRVASLLTVLGSHHAHCSAYAVLIQQPGKDQSSVVPVCNIAIGVCAVTRRALWRCAKPQVIQKRTQMTYSPRHSSSISTAGASHHLLCRRKSLIPRPLVLNTRLQIAANVSRQGAVKATIALFDRTYVIPAVFGGLFSLLLDAVGIAVAAVTGNEVDGTSRFCVAVSLVSDHAGDAFGCNAMQPRLFLRRDGDDGELGEDVSVEFPQHCRHHY
jgi:hypothetical protein